MPRGERPPGRSDGRGVGGWARRLVLVHGRALLPRPASVAAGVTAVVACTAVVTALVSLRSSVTGSVGRFEAAVTGGAQLVVVSRSGAGLPAGAVSRITRTAGVVATEDLLVQPVLVGGHQAVLVGVAGDIGRFASVSTLAPLSRSTARALLTGAVVAGPAVLPHGAGPGSLRVLTRSGEHRARAVPGTSPAMAAVDRGSVLLAAMPEARALAGGGPTSTLVQVAPGVPVDRVARSLRGVLGGAADVDRPATLAALDRAGIADVLAALPVVELVVGLVALVVVGTTMAGIARDAVRHVATMRLLGAGHAHARVATVLIGAGIGAVGLAAGLPLGVVGGHWLLGRLPAFLLASLPVGVTFALPVAAVLTAAAAALGTATVATWLAFRVLRAVPPVEAVRPTATGAVDDRAPAVRPWLVGIAALGAGTALLVVRSRPTTAGVPAAAALVACGGALVVGLMPVLWRGAVAAAAHMGRTGTLTAASLRRSSGRFAVAVAGVTTAVAVVLGVGEIGADGTRTVQATFHSLAAPVLWVGLGTAATVVPNGLPMGDGLRRALQRTAGVAAVRAGQFDTVQIGHRAVLLEGLQAGSATPLIADAPADARRQLAAGTAAVVSTQLAQADHLRPGGQLRLATPTGTHRLRVAAVVTVFVWPQGTVAIALPELRRWFDSPGSSWFEVAPRPGTSLAALRRAVDATAADRGMHVTTLTGTQELAGAESVVSGLTRLLGGVEVLCLIGVSATTFTTLAVSVAQRRRELGLLRAAGASARRVVRSVVLEGLAIGAGGVVMGVPAGLLFEWVGLQVASRAQGLPVPATVDVVPLLVAVGAALAMTVCGAAVPAWRAGRLPVAALVRSE